MTIGFPGMLRPRRGPGLLIRVALVVLLVAPVLDAGLGAGTERLSRVRYHWGGREWHAVGALTYESSERAALRLFDEGLAGYYTIYLATGELLAVEPLSHLESETICVERAAQQATARRRREDHARKRRAARGAARRESARTRSERAAAQARVGSGGRAAAGGSTSFDASDIRAVRRERQRRIRAVERSIDRVAQALEPLVARLEAVVRAHNRNVSSVRDRLAGRPPARLRAWVGEFESFSEELEKLSSHLDSRRGAVDRLRGNLATRSVRTREASEAAEGILVRIASLQKRLARAEKSVGEHRALIAELTDEDFAPMGSALSVDLTLASHRLGGPGGPTSSLRAAADVPTRAGDLTPARDPPAPRLIEHLTVLARGGPARSELPGAVAAIPPEQPTVQATPPAEARSRPPAEADPAPEARSRFRSGLPRGVYLLLAALTLAGVIGALRRVRTRSVSPL